MNVQRLGLVVCKSSEYRGLGRFAGELPDGRDAPDGRFKRINVPGVGRITVYAADGMVPINETRSASDGTWQIEGLNPNAYYTLIGWDDTGVQEAQIFTRQTPAPMT